MKSSVRKQIVKRATEIKRFRTELIKNPKESISKVTGTKLAPDLEIIVVEETAEHLYLLLPVDPDGVSPTDPTSPFVLRAREDPNFHAALHVAPKRTLESFLRVGLPSALKISVLEETPNRHFLVLPPAEPTLLPGVVEGEGLLACRWGPKDPDPAPPVTEDGGSNIIEHPDLPEPDDICDPECDIIITPDKTTMTVDAG